MLDSVTPAEALELAVAFYREVRAEDCDVDADGDMLLFQWGTYDWGSGPSFEFDVTRQFILTAGEAEDIWQLHLTLRFEPVDSLRALGTGHRWCGSPSELGDFLDFARATDAFRHVANRSGCGAALDYGCAG